MQINSLNLINFRGNAKNKADSKSNACINSSVINNHSNPNVGNAVKIKPDVQNLKAYHIGRTLYSPAGVSFGYIEKGDPVKNKPAVEAGCSYNKKTDSLEFGLYSQNAGRVELWIYKQPQGDKDDYKEVARIPLEEGEEDKWTTSVNSQTLKKEGIDINKDAVYYGYRVWGKEGSNWEYDENWKPGSDAGFNSHVDDNGNRFNPNKLLIDPEATEISHDPVTAGINEDGSLYATGNDTYKIDTASFAPKSIFVMPKDEANISLAPKPTRPLTSDNIYETHLKGLTAGHTKKTLLHCYDVLKEEYKDKPETVAEIEQMQKKIAAPPEKGGWNDKYAGTYKGAGYMALYLKLLGFNSVEFLPVQEFQNSEKDGFWKNYWGYMTLAYKAPERNYAFDKTPGGPTREFKEMVNEFHKQGVKVCIDVVYNHTAEGGCHGNPEANGKPGFEEKVLVDKANLYSLRGIDNTSYYRTDKNNEVKEYEGGWRVKHYANKTYNDNMNGCGADLNAANPIAQKLTVDTLRYWKDQMGVDSLRFDLAPVLGNTRSMEHDFFFDSEHTDSLLKKIENLGVRPKTKGNGIDLIAEPWGYGTFQVGNFSANYAEWNGSARDILRRAINKSGVNDVSPMDLLKIFSGSYDTFKHKNPKTVNFIDCHDGYTMHDLFAYDTRRTYEMGSEGGTDDGGNISWSQGGDVNLRKQAVRTAQALLAVSAGTPMIQGGDERYRTNLGNNNPWNIDGPLNYIDWGNPEQQAEIDELRKAGPLKYAEKCKSRGKDKTYKMTEDEKEELTKFTSRLFNFRINHPSLRPHQYFEGKDHNNKNGKDITWLDGDAKELDGNTSEGENYLNNPQNSVIAFRIDSTEFKDTDTAKKDSASSIYVAYNKGAGSFNVKLPEHQLPNRQWYIVADTSSSPNKLLGNENIKKEGNEVPVTEERITCSPKSTVILIEKAMSQ